MKNNLKLMIVLLLQLAVLVFISCSCKKEIFEQNLSPWYPETNLLGDSIYGVFENKLPCFEKGCTKLKFALAIYRNAQTKLPTTYMMARVYVAKDENGRIMNSGEISIKQGIPSDLAATFYELTSGAPDEFKYFWKINENLLFVLDNDLQPRVGNESYGYILNRTQ